MRVSQILYLFSVIAYVGCKSSNDLSALNNDLNQVYLVAILVYSQM